MTDTQSSSTPTTPGSNGSNGSNRPLPHGPIQRLSNRDWRPEQLNLRVLHQHCMVSNFATTPGTLSNDFFVAVLAMTTDWTPADASGTLVNGIDRASGAVRWTATCADLVFGSTAQLRAVCEVYASSDSKEKFVRDFVAARVKVMNLDRFDLQRN